MRNEQSAPLVDKPPQNGFVTGQNENDLLQNTETAIEEGLLDVSHIFPGIFSLTILDGCMLLRVSVHVYCYCERLSWQNHSADISSHGVDPAAIVY